jgi:septal ring factor EnvC (AmiA/AmiB activator)
MAAGLSDFVARLSALREKMSGVKLLTVKLTGLKRRTKSMISLASTLAPPVTDQLYGLLAVISDPAKHKALLDALVSERDAAKAERAELANLQSERDQIAKDRDAFERERASGLTGLAARKAAQEEERRQIEAAQKKHAANVEQLNADRAALEQEKRSHAEQIGEVAKLRQVLRG